jgi:hypothetical protein
MAGVHATMNNGLVVGLRPGPVERTLRRLREQAAQRRADELERLDSAVDARHDSRDPARNVREAVMTPARWTRLT